MHDLLQPQLRQTPTHLRGPDLPREAGWFRVDHTVPFPKPAPPPQFHTPHPSGQAEVRYGRSGRAGEASSSGKVAGSYSEGSQHKKWTFSGGRAENDDGSFEDIHTQLRSAKEVLARLGMQKHNRTRKLAARLKDGGEQRYVGTSANTGKGS